MYTPNETFNRIIMEWNSDIYSKGHSTVNYKEIQQLADLLDVSFSNNIESQQISIDGINFICPYYNDNRKLYALTVNEYSNLENETTEIDSLLGNGYSSYLSEDHIINRY